MYTTKNQPIKLLPNSRVCLSGHYIHYVQILATPSPLGIPKTPTSPTPVATPGPIPAPVTSKNRKNKAKI